MMSLSYVFPVVFLLSFSFFSCGDNELKKLIPENKAHVLERNTFKPSDEEFPLIDTVSLRNFWYNFKESLQADKRDKVIETIDFPVYATHIVLFNFAYNCDTTVYVEREEALKDLVIDEDNIHQYYDFIFSDALKEMIYETSVQDLLSKGRKHKKSLGLSYDLFPKEYRTEIECSNDHLLIFHITFKNDKGWKIKIRGL